MRGLEGCLNGLCLLFCLLSTGYVTYLQFKYYLNNEDLSSISYREFNDEEKDQYPIFRDLKDKFSNNPMRFSSHTMSRGNLTATIFKVGWKTTSINYFPSNLMTLPWILMRVTWSGPMNLTIKRVNRNMEILTCNQHFKILHIFAFRKIFTIEKMSSNPMTSLA